jgi:hypothetical protein
MKVIAIQGPPRSGKDTAAHTMLGMLYAANYDAQQYKAAAPLRQWAQMMTNQMYEMYDELKDTPVGGAWGDLTVRKLMIGLSERLLKPMCGLDIFGKLLWQSMEHHDAIHIRTSALGGKPFVGIISDAGFPEEQAYIQSKVGADNYHILQLARSGCSFQHDSRSYFTLDPSPVERLDNSGTLSELGQSLRMVLSKWQF